MEILDFQKVQEIWQETID